MTKLFFTTVFSYLLFSNVSFSIETNCKQTSKTVGVIELMQAPRCYKGVVELNGVVAKTDSESKTVILIDRNEKDNCDDDTCPIKRLPVLWNGKMPERKSIVLVKGKVSKKDGRFIFVATSFSEQKG